MQKPFLPPPLQCFLGAFWSSVLGTLIRFRTLPFLQADTISSGGKQVPAEQFAHFTSNFFYGGAVAFFALGVVSILTLTDTRRRYVAQLPRWQRWMYWPFASGVTVVAPRSTPAGQPVEVMPAEHMVELPVPDLPTALGRYWYHLTGVASFASIMTLFHLPALAVPPLFFGSALFAAWPTITKRAPYSFWIVAVGVWMGGGLLAAILGAIAGH